MDIYYFCAALYGIFFKLFDDIIDNNTFRSIFGKYDIFFEELFKYIIVSLTDILTLKDPLFGSIIVLGFTGNVISDNFLLKEENNKEKTLDNSFWWIYYVVTIFITFISFMVSENYNFNLYIFIALVILVAIISIIEPYYFPENTSKNKNYSRLLAIILSLIILYFSNIIKMFLNENIDYAFYFITLLITYLSTSLIINNLYLLKDNNKTD